MWNLEVDSVGKQSSNSDIAVLFKKIINLILTWKLSMQIKEKENVKQIKITLHEGKTNYS